MSNQRRNLMKVEKSIHINCPPEKAFAFATDFANASKWMVGFIESKTLTDGETRVGTQYMFVSKLFGQRMEMKSEVTAWEPPARYEYKTVDAPASMRGGFAFTAQDGGTLVNVWGGTAARWSTCGAKANSAASSNSRKV
ncbi:hypothetical protein FBQ81_17610 [Chloroflexi bacterium CFX6]|nr:hypothetical protein [Chloroflexi bacterium CFX6]